jgi:pimeloyl-ACP methyl ester carboxylesterase
MMNSLEAIGAAVAALIALDIVMGRLIDYRQFVRVYRFLGSNTNGDTNNVVFALPGWGQDGRAVGAILANNQMDQFATVVALDYPHKGFSIEELYRVLTTELRSLQPTAWTAVGGSMGGQVWFELMRHYRAERHAEPYGRPLPPIFDSAPACADDIMMPRWSFKVMRWLGHGPIATGIKAIGMWLAAPRPRAQSDPGIDQDALERLYHMTTWYPYPGAAAQAAWMGSFDARALGSNELVPTIHFIKGEPNDDGVVRNAQAVTHWGEVALVVVHTDDTRGPRDHNLVQRPNFITEVVRQVFEAAAEQATS